MIFFQQIKDMVFVINLFFSDRKILVIRDSILLASFWKIIYSSNLITTVKKCIGDMRPDKSRRSSDDEMGL